MYVYSIVKQDADGMIPQIGIGREQDWVLPCRVISEFVSSRSGLVGS